MYQHYGKRAFDFVSALTVLIILSPLLLYIAWQVKKHLGSPVIFTQVRPGKDDKLFRLYKFRSMRDAVDEHGRPLPDSERMTDFGRRLRATSLDELPELINIVKGDMSVVGPRPQLVRDMVFFTTEEMQRQSVLPGLTGLAQISGRNNIDWKQRFHYDLEYAQHITFREDMRIIFRTVFKVSAQEDIATEGMDTSEDYGDWLLRQGLVDESTYATKQQEASDMLESFTR